MYLMKDGSLISKKPDPDNYVEIPIDVSVQKTFTVLIFRGDHAEIANAEVVATESFPHAPTNDQILWCLLRHNGDYVRIREIFSLCKLPF